MDLPSLAQSAASAAGAALSVAGGAASAAAATAAGAAASAAAAVAQAPMVARMDTTQLMALAAALGWASGLRLYLVLFLTGLAGTLGWVPLPPGLHLLQNPLVLGASGVMLFVEFFADKIPGLDTVWDAIHTFIRIPAGAALAGAALGGDGATWSMVAAILGGSLAATSHVAKATTRAAVNTSPEPFSNVLVSLVGDAAVPGMMWLAWQYPVPFFVVLAVVLVLMIVLIVVLFRFVRRVFRPGSRPLRDVRMPA